MNEFVFIHPRCCCKGSHRCNPQLLSPLPCDISSVFVGFWTVGEELDQIRINPHDPGSSPCCTLTHMSVHDAAVLRSAAPLLSPLLLETHDAAPCTSVMDEGIRPGCQRCRIGVGGGAVKCPVKNGSD